MRLFGPLPALRRADTGDARDEQPSPRIVDLGPRARTDPLALEIERRLLAQPRSSLARATFERTWGTVVLVRRLPPAALHLRELTLRFDYGRLVIHDGRVGRPDVTLWGTDEQILGLGGRSAEGTRLQGLLRRSLSWLGADGLVSSVSVAWASSAEQLQAFGALSHVRLFSCVVRLLRPPASEAHASPPDP